MEKDASKKAAMFARGINNLFIYATCIVSVVGKRRGRGVRSGGHGVISPGHDSQISPNDTDPEQELLPRNNPHFFSRPRKDPQLILGME